MRVLYGIVPLSLMEIMCRREVMILRGMMSVKTVWHRRTTVRIRCRGVVVGNWVRISVVRVGSWMIWYDFIKYVFLVRHFKLALMIVLKIASTDVTIVTSLQVLIFLR